MSEEKSEKRQEHNFVWFLAKMMKFPLTAFANGLELFVKTIHEMQRMADDGIELFTKGETKREQSFDANPGQPEIDLKGNLQDASLDIEKKCENPVDKPERRINERDLRDDLLKLVRYKILFVKREYEHAFAEQESLIAENMDAAAFTAWKAAEFIQRLGNGKTEVPEKWRTRNYPPKKYRDGSVLKGLPEEDKKYLRVFYQVIERFPREQFKFEEQQIEVLEQIRDSINSVKEVENKHDEEN